MTSTKSRPAFAHPRLGGTVRQITLGVSTGTRYARLIDTHEREPTITDMEAASILAEKSMRVAFDD